MSDGFAFHAEHTPGNVALSIGPQSWTYGEASEIARRWAARLLDVSRRRPMRVGILAYRSETAYLGVLAALFAGAAFVPLHPRFPTERTRVMVEQADLDALVVDSGSLARLAELASALPEDLPILTPDSAAPVGSSPRIVLGREDLARTPPLTSLPEIGPDDLAYLLFTSGSTGLPKGVPITHRNVRAFLDVNRARYDFGPDDRFTQTFDQTFDLSIFDLFMAWESGARVCSMRPIELLAPFPFLLTQQVTVWFSVPSVAGRLTMSGRLKPGIMPTLRWSLFCGEALPRRIAEAWAAAAPNSILENLYGPTELTIACSAHRWSPSTSPGRCVNDLVPIGELYPGLYHLLVDESLNEVPEDQPGELCVAGSQATRGYWRAPELDVHRFFERTRDGVTRRYYRTGDVVAPCPGGGLAYLRRTDQQVKIGGYRIELGEIEAVLRRAGCVVAVALPWPDSATEPDSIVAVVSSGDPAALKAELARSVPAYMMPSTIVTLEKMPLNSNAKIDRKALATLLRDRIGTEGDA